MLTSEARELSHRIFVATLLVVWSDEPRFASARTLLDEVLDRALGSVCPRLGPQRVLEVCEAGVLDEILQVRVAATVPMLCNRIPWSVL